MKTLKEYEGMLPDFMGIKVLATNEKEAMEKVLEKVLEELTIADVIVWEAEPR